MAVILRIDVDDSYPNRILHYARVNQELFFGIDALGYSRMTKTIVDDLNDRNIGCSLFFQPYTVPNKEFAEDLLRHGHSIGLHAVHTANFEIFLKDLYNISKKFDGNIYGFTKHGSGKAKLSRNHDPNYNPDLFLEYAKKSKLKYFLGNLENPEIYPKIINGVLYYPSAFWINRNYRRDEYSIEWLINESVERDIVVLMHPEDIIRGTELVLQEYEKILDQANFITVDKKLSALV